MNQAEIILATDEALVAIKKELNKHVRLINKEQKERKANRELTVRIVENRMEMLRSGVEVAELMSDTEEELVNRLQDEESFVVDSIRHFKEILSYSLPAWRVELYTQTIREMEDIKISIKLAIHRAVNDHPM